jgi:hypothetical protein
MDIGEILSSSGKLYWRHKVLWLVGILGVVPIAFSIVVTTGLNPLLMTGSFASPQALNSPTAVYRLLGATAGFIALFCLIEIVAAVVFLFCLNALTLGVQQAEQGAERLRFGSLFHESRRYFWRVAGVGLIFGAVFLVLYLLFILFFTLVSLVTFGIGALCLYPFIFLLIPVSYVAVAFIEQAYISVVTRDLGVVEAIRAAWDLLKSDFWRFVLLSILLYMVFGLILGVVIFPLLIPSYIPMFAAMANNGQVSNTIWVLSTLAMCVAAPLFAVVYGLGYGLIRTIWTVTNLRLTSRALSAPPAPPQSEPLNA